MNRLFRKYHRWIAWVLFLPLGLTVITGMLTTIAQSWPFNWGLSSSLLLDIHTGAIFGLGGIYPLFNGLGVLGLLVTGCSMLGLFGRKRRPS